MSDPAIAAGNVSNDFSDWSWVREQLDGPPACCLDFGNRRQREMYILFDVSYFLHTTS
jgi:hypothetical protein